MGERECRELVLERSGGVCERCGKSWPLTLHHRKKRSQGGGWCPTNCVMVCGHGTAGCHGWIEDHPLDAEALGFHVRPWGNPADVPVRYPDDWYRLLPDGTKELEVPF